MSWLTGRMQRGLGGAGGAALPALRFASALNRAPSNAMSAAAGTQLTMWIRYPVIIGSSNQSAVVLSFSAKSMQAAGEVNTSAYTVLKVAFERVTVPGFAPMTFSGGRTKTINAGDSDVHTDDLLPSAFGLASFAVGETYFMRVQLSVAAAGAIMPNCPIGSGVTGQWLMWYDPATFTIQDTDHTGLPTFSGSGFAFNNSGAYLPIVLGRPTNAAAKVWAGVGDSIMQNTGDTVLASGVGGWFQRALFDADFVSNPHAGCNFGIFGANSDQWNGATQARGLLEYANRMVEEYGTNLSTVTEQASSASIWAAAKALGMKIIRTKLIAVTTSTQSTTALTSVGTTATLAIATGSLPAAGSSVLISGATPAAYNGTFTVVTSGAGVFTYTMGSSPGVSATGTILWSDLWESLANQTKAAAWLPGGDRVNFNAFLDAQFALNSFDTLLDWVSITSDPSDRYYWLTDGVTAKLTTGDGTHPSPALHISMATMTRAAMAAL